MNNDVRRWSQRVGLEPNPHPAVGFVSLFETARLDGVGEDKETSGGPSLLLKPLIQQRILVLEHAMEPLARHITLGDAVNRIADCHVVSGHRFRDGSRSAAHPKEPARHFLPRPDLGKGAILRRVKIDLQRLLMRPCNLSIHSMRNITMTLRPTS